MWKDGSVVACKHACFAAKLPEHCCTGQYNRPQTCKPTNYSNGFKATCPTAITYVLDTLTSLNFTCQEANYLCSHKHFVHFGPSNLFGPFSPFLLTCETHLTMYKFNITWKKFLYK